MAIPPSGGPSPIALQAAAEARAAGYGYLELAIYTFDAFNFGRYATADALMEALMEAELPEEVLGATGILAAD
jgi:hypothetical protein